MAAASRPSFNPMVFDCRKACSTRIGTAVMSPKAVQFMASEMLADSRFALSAGFTVATAANAWIRPLTVPRSPSSVATLASVAR
jgi:hypothetical protein